MRAHRFSFGSVQLSFALFLAPWLAVILALLPRVAWAGTITVDGMKSTRPVAITVANIDNDTATNSAVAGAGGSIINDIDQAGLTLEKSANVSQAVAGDTVIYTYRITNTGTVPLSIAAHDNRLGAVNGLAGVLAPSLSAVANLTYVVQSSDQLGPLVNTVTVTGTPEVGTPIVVNDTATIQIGQPTALPDIEQPRQGRRETYLPQVGN